MCIGVWSTEHPAYALILAANRDEFLSRPTAAAVFHSFEQDPNHEGHGGDILSGRDVLAGGTWLGVNKESGRVVLLTNITEPPARYDISRGNLVTSFLCSQGNVQPGIDALVSFDSKFAGFNLLVFTPSTSESISFDAIFLTNGGGGNPIISRPLTSSEKHCGALSNGIDGKGGNLWPKIQDALAGLGTILEQDLGQNDMNVAESLFELLSQTTRSPPAYHGNCRHTIRVDPLFRSNNPAEDNLQQNGLYATRLTTVVLVKRDGDVTFIERDIWYFDEDRKMPVLADPSSQRLFKFRLNSS